MEDTVSIIIPTRNRRDLLQKSIHSILCQHINQFSVEIIVISDASEHDEEQCVIVPTRQWIASHNSRLGNFRIIFERFNNGPKGPALIRNKGMEKASGRYLMFLDDDDEFYDEDVLSRLYCTIKGKSHAFIYGDTVMLRKNSRGEWQRVHRFRLSPYSKMQHIQSYGIIPIGSFMFTLENDSPVFRTDIEVGEDFEWQMRLLRNYRFEHLDDLILKYFRADSGYHLQMSRNQNARDKSFRIINRTIKEILHC